MAGVTKQIRDYGGIGAATLAGALANLSRDKKTYSDALAAVGGGDALELAHDPGGLNYVAIDYATACWNNGTLAVGTGVSLVVAGTSASGGPLFNGGAGKTGFLLTGTGDSDPTGWGGEKSGKFAIIIDPAQTKAHPHTQVMAFTTSDGIEVSYVYILGNWDTLASGCATGNQMSTAGFTYPGTGGCSSTNPGANDITLRCVTYDHGPAGYGPTQVQSGTNLRFFSLKAIGGKALRVEQDAGNMNYVRNLTADGIYGKYNSRGVVALETHDDNSCKTTGKAPGGLENATITNVTSEESGSGIHIGGRCNPSNGAGFRGTITIDGVAIQGSTGSGTASDPYSKNAQVITGGGSGSQACFDRASSKSVLDGTKPACVTLSGVVTKGYFSGGTQGYNNSAGFSAQFGVGFPCSAGPITKVGGTVTPHGALTIAPTTRPSITPGGAVTPTGALAIAPVAPKVVGGNLQMGGALTIQRAQAPPPAPTWLHTPETTDRIAFFSAESSVVGQWVWSVDGQTIVTGTVGTHDDLNVPVLDGEHTVTARIIDVNGATSPPVTFSWLVAGTHVIPQPVKILGRGQYSVYVRVRGGIRISAGYLPYTNLSWSRVWSDTGECQVVIDGISNIAPGCCDLVGLIEDWVHELAVYRSGFLVWQGPVVSVAVKNDQATITANDLSVWLSRRRIHDRFAADNGAQPTPTPIYRDLENQALAYVQSAMRVDPSVTPASRSAAALRRTRRSAAMSLTLWSRTACTGR
jgi:hypothetical protein